MVAINAKVPSNRKKANKTAIHSAQPEYFSDKELTLKMSILKLLMVVNLCYQLS